MFTVCLCPSPDLDGYQGTGRGDSAAAPFGVSQTSDFSNRSKFIIH
jgi:hypothetical protein